MNQEQAATVVALHELMDGHIEPAKIKTLRSAANDNPKEDPYFAEIEEDYGDLFFGPGM